MRRAFKQQHIQQDIQSVTLSCAVFASDLQLEGINVSPKPSMIIGEPDGQPSFVISQGFIEATVDSLIE